MFIIIQKLIERHHDNVYLFGLCDPVAFFRNNVYQYHADILNKVLPERHSSQTWSAV